MKSIVIAHENTDGFQALYVDGFFRDTEETIYVSTILEFITPLEPITLQQKNVDLPEGCEWPHSLKELMEMCGEATVDQQDN